MKYKSFLDAVEICDSMRSPINKEERAKRIAGKPAAELYPYYGATGQVGVIDGYLTDGEYVLLGEDGAPFLDAFATKAYLISGKAWVNNHAHVLKSKTNNKFLYYYLNYFNYKGYVSGTTRLKLTQAEMKRIPIPDVSIEEQARIVARIEELFSELDAGVETLQKIKRQLTVYRRSVLSDAFEGRMTAQWREKNCKNTEDLVRTARNKRDSILSSKRLKKLKYEWKEDIELPNIPREWEYAQIGDVAWEIKDGPHYSPEYVDEGIPFITGGNVRPSGVDFDNAKRISPELHKELSRRCRPEKGDMLYTKGGTTGIARVNTYDHEFSVWVHVAVIKYVDSVLPAYFQYVLNSPLCYQQSQKYTHGVGNQDLGLTRMINIIFPLCDVEEQKEIVRELESRLSVCDSIEKTVDEALQQSAAMRQSILKQAFEGGL